MIKKFNMILFVQYLQKVQLYLFKFVVEKKLKLFMYLLILIKYLLVTVIFQERVIHNEASRFLPIV